ncbi:hypothetical protein HZU77_004180 [Neisseriaceae bacterium TC5R-5]|nr:hypothetical protein [Neisseriaceae bacterium TC5R-5]
MPATHDFNPHLNAKQQRNLSQEGGQGAIHQPGQYQNLIWQTRPHAPDAFTLNLIAQLETIFDNGEQELPQIVAQLNQQRSFRRDGQVWTEASFSSFLAEQGY